MLEDFRRNVHVISALEKYELEENGCDKGQAIRKLSKGLCKMIRAGDNNDPDYL
jgi:hypothetical protein